MLEFLRSGLASRLNINVERAGLVYFPVKFTGIGRKRGSDRVTLLGSIRCERDQK